MRTNMRPLSSFLFPPSPAGSELTLRPYPGFEEGARPVTTGRLSPDDYKQIGEIRNGLQAETGEVPDLTPALPLYAPGVNAEDFAQIAKEP